MPRHPLHQRRGVLGWDAEGGDVQGAPCVPAANLEGVGRPEERRLGHPDDGHGELGGVRLAEDGAQRRQLPSEERTGTVGGDLVELGGVLSDHRGEGGIGRDHCRSRRCAVAELIASGCEVAWSGGSAGVVAGVWVTASR